MDDFTIENVKGFLNSLEEAGNSVATRNQRLAAIKSFCRFVLEDSPYRQVRFEGVSPKTFYALDKGRIFVNIYELRRKLNWPREVFDAMLIKLRDEEIIQLHEGDASTKTPDENADCFIDENNIRMGTVTWNAGK